jgi:hypothetical protein
VYGSLVIRGLERRVMLGVTGRARARQAPGQSAGRYLGPGMRREVRQPGTAAPVPGAGRAILRRAGLMCPAVLRYFP